MATTTWVPYTHEHPLKWVLKDGTTVSVPDLEVSGSGRRVRIKGTTKSFSAREIPDLVHATVQEVATQRGTEPLLVVDEASKMQRAAIESVYGHYAPTNPDLLVLDFSGNQNFHVVRFEANGVDAYLVTNLVYSGSRQYVQQHLVYRFVTNETAINASLSYGQMSSTNDWAVPPSWYYYDPNVRRLRDEFSMVKASVNISTTHYQNNRVACGEFLAKIRAADEVEEINIPDFRNTKTATWLTLKRVATNGNLEAERLLSDIVNAGPIVDELKKLSGEMLKKLRLLGFVIVNEPSDSAYDAAATGDLSNLEVAVRPGPNPAGGEMDQAHNVFLNLVTGHVEVTCANDPQLRVEAGTAWEVAKFKAELTGEADELLAYAKQYVAEHAAGSVKQRDAELAAKLNL